MTLVFKFIAKLNWPLIDLSINYGVTFVNTKKQKSEIIADLQSYFHGQYQEAYLLNFDIKKLSDQLYQGDIAVMALA